MALTKVGKEGITGISNSSDANAITIDSSENVTLGSGKELRFVDSNESIKSDGSKLIIKSGGTTFNLPTSDGSSGQALVTDASGTLSFAAAGASLANDANNRVTTATGSGGLNGESALTFNGFTLGISPSGTGNAVEFRAGGVFCGRIAVFTSNATAYVTSSDYRLKENIVPLSDALNRVKQLKPKRFNFIEFSDNTVDGFLAHEAQTVVPEAVTGTHNGVDDDNNPVYQGIDQSKLVPLLTAALQEAIAKIETLETKVAALEAG